MADPPSALFTRNRDHQWDAAGAFVKTHLVPGAPLTQHISVIGRKHNDGVLIEPCRLQGVHHLSYKIIDQRDGAVITMARSPNMIVGYLEFAAIIVPVKPLPMGITV